MISNLTNKEYLQSLEDVRYRSPVIGELCRRLEAVPILDADTTPTYVSCPACQAKLEILIEEDSHNLTLTFP